MDFFAICRTCLSGNNLKPIFLGNEDKDNYSNAIFIAIGVQIKQNDTLPQSMCTDCVKKVTDILQFRLECKNVETKLITALQDETDRKDTDNDVINTTIKIEYDDSIDCDESLIETEIKCMIEPKLEVANSDYQGIGSPNKRKTTQKSNLERNICDSNKDSDIVESLHVSDDTKQELKLNTIKKVVPKVLKDVSKIKSKLKTKLSDSNLQETKSKTKVKNNDSNPNNNSIIDESLDESEQPFRLILDPVTNKVVKSVCKLCNKELSVRSIDSHISRRHPGADGRKVKCELCDSYIMKTKINRHVIMMHGASCFKCGYCKIEFNTKEDLVDHVTNCKSKKTIRKSNSGRKLQECDICHKVMQKNSIRLHKAVKHGGMRPVCEHCGKSFGNKYRLKEHYRAKHGYEKFQCSYCDFKSASALALQNHERRHRDEKPYVCETCGAKFHASYLLAQHKHSHRTEKLIKCDLCPSVFKANNTLHMHKLTCHSTSTYRCTICSRSYKCRHYAVKHIRHVHRYAGNLPPLTVVVNDNLMGDNKE